MRPEYIAGAGRTAYGGVDKEKLGMPLNESVRVANGQRRSTSRNLGMSRFCLRGVLPSLIAALFVFAPAAKASSIPASGPIPSTGQPNCTLPNIYAPNCIDFNYFSAPGSPYDDIVADSGLAVYSGFTPSVGTWDTTGNDDQEYGGCQYTSNCPVFVWSVIFPVPVGQTNISVNGFLAANGPVSAAVDGAGGYLGENFSTAADSAFSLTNVSVNDPTAPGVSCGATICLNTLDFIFTGCTDWPACSATYSYDPDLMEPLSELYVDPTWTTAAPGAPLDDIPESVLIANGGAAPASSPEPGSLLLIGAGLLGVAGALRRKRRGQFR